MKKVFIIILFGFLLSGMILCFYKGHQSSMYILEQKSTIFLDKALKTDLFQRMSAPGVEIDCGTQSMPYEKAIGGIRLMNEKIDTIIPYKDKMQEALVKTELYNIYQSLIRTVKPIFPIELENIYSSYMMQDGIKGEFAVIYTDLEAKTNGHSNPDLLFYSDAVATEEITFGLQNEMKVQGFVKPNFVTLFHFFPAWSILSCSIFLVLIFVFIGYYFYARRKVKSLLNNKVTTDPLEEIPMTSTSTPSEVKIEESISAIDEKQNEVKNEIVYDCTTPCIRKLDNGNYQIGLSLLDVSNLILWCNNKPIHFVLGKRYRLLLMLLNEPTGIIPAKLMKSLYMKTDSNTLNSTITSLRAILKEDPTVEIVYIMGGKGMYILRLSENAFKK